MNPLDQKTLKLNKDIYEGVDWYERRKICLEIHKLISELDQPEKALTGRRDFKYELESGVSKEELFPKDGYVLNIGDPWQTLDIPNVLSLEYASGEEELFHFKSWKDLSLFESFRRKYLQELFELKNVILSIKEYSNSFSNQNLFNLDFFLNDLNEIFKLISLKKYEIYNFKDIAQKVFELGDNFLKIKKELRSIEESDEVLSRDFWFVVQNLGRLFDDAYLYFFKIKPAILKNILKHSPFTEEEVWEKIIAKERFFKKMNEAQILKGAWPDVWFPDESFDRVIASWSISAHIYRAMSEKQHKFFFDEFDRILKKDGVAYVWPVGYYHSSFDDFLSAVALYIKDGGDVGLIKEGFFVSAKKDFSNFEDHLYNISSGHFPTLVVFKKKCSSSVYTRVKDNLLPYDFSTDE